MKMILRTLVILFLLAGCEERHEHDTPADPTPAAAVDEQHSATLLRIDPEMVRDLRVTTTTVESRPGGEGVAVLGELRVNDDAYAEVGPPIAGRIVSVRAAAGEQVTAGQPLAVLQSVELGKARAEYTAAKATAQLARQTLDRKRGLAAERIVAARDLQTAEASSAAAEAHLRAARATLQALGVAAAEIEAPADAPADFTLRTPIAGTVIDRAAVLGQFAEPADPLFRIADLSHLWLTVHAFERDAVRVVPGTTARITFPAFPGQTFSGTIAVVGSQVDAHSRTVPVRIDLPNEHDVLRPGMSATAWLKLGGATDTVLTVPAAALQRIGGNWCVFLPRRADAFEIRPVGRGRDLGGEVELLSGVQAGDTVVVEGSFLLKAEADKGRGGGGHDHDH